MCTFQFPFGHFCFVVRQDVLVCVCAVRVSASQLYRLPAQVQEIRYVTEGTSKEHKNKNTLYKNTPFWACKDTFANNIRVLPISCAGADDHVTYFDLRAIRQFHFFFFQSAINSLLTKFGSKSSFALAISVLCMRAGVVRCCRVCRACVACDSNLHVYPGVILHVFFTCIILVTGSWVCTFFKFCQQR